MKKCDDIRGIIPAMITPLTTTEEVNQKGIRELVEHLIKGGVHGIFVIGTAGEFYGLDLKQKQQIIETSIDAIAGRVPVYVGTGAMTTKEAVALTGMAEKSGADVVSVLTPFFLSPTETELYEHFKRIADSTNLPVILYNNLPKTGVTISPSVVKKLSDQENIVGIKDSTGDLTLTTEYLQAAEGKDFRVLLGRDTLIYAGLCSGAVGAIATCANVAPKLCVQIYEEFVNGNLREARAAQQALSPLRLAFGMGTFPSVVKASLKMIGIDAGPCISPAGELTDEACGRLRSILQTMNLL